MFWGIALLSHAQIQQGYVKTLGRPNKPGMALSGVSVRIMGAHNAVLSKQDGTFSMSVQGNSYTFQQIQKSGYELNESGMIGRRYAYSSKVKMTIVMVSSSQLHTEKQRIENKAYAVAEKNYQTKLAKLEQQQAANQITIEQYRKEIEILQNSFEKYQSLIDGLADHYARTDYDELTTKESEISQYIEKGDLDKAEQLLQELNIEQRLAEIEQRIKLGLQLQHEADEEMSRILKQQEKDAEYLYQLYTIALAQFDNEKARFYIETRASLDETNVKWMLEAGEFLQEYLSDYSGAKKYFDKAYKQCMKRKEGNSREMTDCYGALGTVYYYMGKYDDAKKMYSKALEGRLQLYGEIHESLVEPYCCIGNIIFAQTQYDKTSARAYYQKGLDICNVTKGDNHPDIAACYYSLSLCDFSTGMLHKITNGKQYQQNMASSVSSLNKAIELWKGKSGIENSNVAHCYKALGDIYLEYQDFKQAIAYTEKALSIWKKMFGEMHVKVSDAYFSLGSIYSSMYEYEKGLSYYREALEIREHLFGANHPRTAAVKKEIESVQSEVRLKSKLSDDNDMDKAIALMNKGEYNKALDIFKGMIHQLKQAGDLDSEAADVYSFMAIISNLQEDKKTALDYYRQAISIWEKEDNIQHPDGAMAYLMAGYILFTEKEYPQVVDYGKKSLNIWKALEGNYALDIANTHSLISKAYLMTGHLIESKQHLEAAIQIKQKVHGEANADVKDLQTILDFVKQLIANNKQ